MLNPDNKTIALQLSMSLKDGLNQQFIRIMELLVKGKPVTPEQISAEFNLSLSEVPDALSKLSNIELDSEGNITGCGITLNPTPHQFNIKGNRLYTWCAFDTLFFPVILKETALVESKCLSTGTDIKLTITPEKIENLEPAEAIISIAIPKESDVCCSIRGAFCNKVNFFASKNSAKDWLKDKEDILLMTVNDAYIMGQEFTRYLFDIV